MKKQYALATGRSEEVVDKHYFVGKDRFYQYLKVIGKYKVIRAGNHYVLPGTWSLFMLGTNVGNYESEQLFPGPSCSREHCSREQLFPETTS